ncbi:MAG: acetate--CoA ligase family protein, partial [Bacteroidota bacterium]|nr:acetate--CoA ligase family protein [Bacteroidota bacterium]
FVEIFRDVSFRVAPIDKKTAIDMIKEIQSSKMLMGARGRKVLDIDSIAEAIMRLSQLALDCPQIKELDINPLIVLEEGKGCLVADAKIII